MALGRYLMFGYLDLGVKHGFIFPTINEVLNLHYPAKPVL